MRDLHLMVKFVIFKLDKPNVYEYTLLATLYTNQVYKIVRVYLHCTHI